MERDNSAHITVKCEHLIFLKATAKAILVQEDEELGGDSRRKLWMPISQIRKAIPALNRLESGDPVELEIPRWLADEKELPWD